MDPNLFAFGKPLAARMLNLVITPLKDMFSRRSARSKAIRGDDLVGQGSLESLVRIQLEKLATSSVLPTELNSEEFRMWLLQGDHVEPFVQVLISRAGNQSELAKKAEEALAVEYERITGQTRKLTAGPLALVVSHVYGQLQATEAGQRALQIALATWSAAQLFRLNHSAVEILPANVDLPRVHSMALILLEAGRNRWKMPQFVAPLSLEALEEQAGDEFRLTNIAELTDVVDAGGHLLLFGEGGIGKTTFLLNLCSACLDAGRRRVPLYVDAAAWARSNSGVLDYIASGPSAQLFKVTSAELVKLAEAGYLALLMNGWNEIPASREMACRDLLGELIAAAPALSVTVVSRMLGDAAYLPVAKRIKVQGLTWTGQSTVIRAELSDELAEPLLLLLAKDTRLRHAARSPLILRGLIARAGKREFAASSVYELLGAVVQAFELDGQRAPILNDGPIFGLQGAYLEELACQLNSQYATNISREDALSAITAAANRLAERGLLGPLPQPAQILDVLGSHHLLHFEDGAVRFAHQRFQEYFAASRLLGECTAGGAVSKLLHSAINSPAWGDSLLLLAGRLKGAGNAALRTYLIKAVANLDLGLTCDLAGVCALTESDDPEFQHSLVARVNKMVASPLEEVQDLGIAYQIASGFPAFAETLWARLEAENHQTRLNTYRLNGSGISLTQLGPSALERVTAWPAERRIEFLQELASNTDNYDFLVSVARNELDHAVRSAAICTLFWDFPASEVPMRAWLDSPQEVQTDPGVISCIQYAMEEGQGGVEVREMLQAMPMLGVSEGVQLKLALTFPNEVGPRVIDVVLAKLQGPERLSSDTSLVAIAKVNAPERLMRLAEELALRGRNVPDWVSIYLFEATAEARAEVFERAWNILQSAEFENLSATVLGPLANRDQVQRAVLAWLRHSVDRPVNPKDEDHARNRQLGYLLANAPANDLLGVVMERGPTASYEESAELIELLWVRVGRDNVRARASQQWVPTVDEIKKLVSCFGEKVEAAEVRQDKVLVFLCCIACQVAPYEFESLLLETCRRHLDAWTTFRAAIDRWASRSTSARPQNPMLGSYLATAVAKWGLDALPGLMALMTHPSAMEFIPEAIGRIVNLPWSSKKEGFFSSVSTDVLDGEQRRKAGRILRQPDNTYQELTDAAARILSQEMMRLVDRLQQEKAASREGDSQQGVHSIRHLLNIVANIPSGEILLSVNSVLASGLVEIYGFVGALRGLVRQGVAISDKDVVRQLEALYERQGSSMWLDDSTKHAMAELSELIYCVEPTTLLSKSPGHYLSQWRRFTYIGEVIRHLGHLHSEVAWPLLLALGNELSSAKPPPEELVFALASALTPRHFPQFIEIVANGTLFSWSKTLWDLERVAPHIASVIGNDYGRRDALLHACNQNASPLADGFANAVLSQVKESDATRLQFGLDAVDAGRAVDRNMPSFLMLQEMFQLRVPMSYQGQYEIHPKSRNGLRTQLYFRAKGHGAISVGCRRLLAAVEIIRREGGRPSDEARHPDSSDGVAWTDIFESAA